MSETARKRLLGVARARVDPTCVPSIDAAFLVERILEFREAVTAGDSDRSDAVAHVVTNVIKGTLLPIDAILCDAVRLMTSLAGECGNVAALHEQEVRAFGDHMSHLQQFNRDLRQGASCDRDSVSLRFATVYDRSYFRTKRYEQQQDAFRLRRAAILHDPVTRCEACISGEVLYGSVVGASEIVVSLRCDSSLVETVVGDRYQRLDDTRVVFELVAVRLDGDGRILDFTTAKASGARVGERLELLSLVSDEKRRPLEMVGRRLGRGREPWTHRAEVAAPAPRFRHHEVGLTGLLKSTVGPK